MTIKYKIKSASDLIEKLRNDMWQIWRTLLTFIVIFDPTMGGDSLTSFWLVNSRLQWPNHWPLSAVVIVLIIVTMCLCRQNIIYIYVTGNFFACRYISTKSWSSILNKIIVSHSSSNQQIYLSHTFWLHVLVFHRSLLKRWRSDQNYSIQRSYKFKSAPKKHFKYLAEVKLDPIISFWRHHDTTLWNIPVDLYFWHLLKANRIEKTMSANMEWEEETIKFHARFMQCLIKILSVLKLKYVSEPIPKQILKIIGTVRQFQDHSLSFLMKKNKIEHQFSVEYRIMSPVTNWHIPHKGRSSSNGISCK